jgi:hypothetical protein
MEPVEYEIVERRVFGLAPAALVGVVAAVLALAGVYLLAAGPVLAGILLLLASLLLASLYVDRLRRPADRVRWATGFAGGSVAALAAAGRDVTRLRLEGARLTKERARAVYDLEHGDERAAERLEELDRRMTVLADRAHDALRRTRRRVREEHAVAARTMVLPPEQ